MLKAIIILLILPLTIYSQTNFKSLEPADFELALRNQEDPVLIDLRDVDSYTKGHIKKASVIDFLRDDFKEYFFGKYKKDVPIYLYAQSAENSENAGMYIQELGYTNITVLKGGFEGWIQKSKPYRSLSPVFKPLSYITKANYQKLVEEQKWVFVVFHEDYCKACEDMTPLFAELKKEIPEFQILKINAQTNVELAASLSITKNPTLLLYRNGIQVWKTTGVITKQMVKEHIY